MSLRIFSIAELDPIAEQLRQDTEKSFSFIQKQLWLAIKGGRGKNVLKGLDSDFNYQSLRDPCDI